MAVVEGRLQVRDWKDTDGNRRRNTEVVAESVYFGDSKRDSAPAAPEPGGNQELQEIANAEGDVPF